MAIFKCKMCGGDLNIVENETVCTCEYCGTKQTVPKLDDDKIASLYDRANYYRRQNEFDKAMGVYETILAENNEDSEAYWSLVLCRYGIEYVEDPRSHKRIPTVNRAQYRSIFDDEDYQKAISLADESQRAVYAAEAKAIDEIQKGILAISKKEEPFDIFICYKETDANGDRTEDSVYAQDIYNALTDEGLKVFFSRITLEGKLGEAYEPYIFAALNSAKVMLVVGTKSDNFNAVWVKNEWSRFLGLMKDDKTKNIIPLYKGISPYDLPDEFSFLQSQDMGKIGYLQDLVHGVKKLINKDKPQRAKQRVDGKPSIDTLIERINIFLSEGNYNSANNYCERVLDLDPTNENANLGKLLIECKIRKKEQLEGLHEPFDQSVYYERILNSGSDSLKNELMAYADTVNLNYATDVHTQALNELKSATTVEQFEAVLDRLESIKHIINVDSEIESLKNKINTTNAEIAERIRRDNEIQEKHDKQVKLKNNIKFGIKFGFKAIVACIVIGLILYGILGGSYRAFNKAVDYIDRNSYVSAQEKFDKSFKKDKYKEKAYKQAEEYASYGKNEQASFVYECLGDYEDAKDKAVKCAYTAGSEYYEQEDYEQAARLLFKGIGYEDSEDKYNDACYKLDKKYNRKQTIDVGYFGTVAVKADGTVYGDTDEMVEATKDWADIVSITTNQEYVYGLKSDGTVVVNSKTGEFKNSLQENIAGLQNIVSIKSGGNICLALGADGRLYEDGVVVEEDDFFKIVSIDSGCNIRYCIDSSKKFVQDRSFENPVSTDADHHILVNDKGNIEAINTNINYSDDVTNATNVVKADTGYDYVVMLKSDGKIQKSSVNALIDQYKDIENYSNIADFGVYNSGSYWVLDKNGKLVIYDYNGEKTTVKNIKVPEYYK